MASSKPLAMPLLALVAALCSAGPVQASIITKVVTSYSDPYNPCDNLGPCQYCDPYTKKPVPKMYGTSCDDGDYCNGAEYCDAYGVCVNDGMVKTCDKDNTVLPWDAEEQCVGRYTCDKATGDCKAVFRGGDCYDGDLCSLGDSCNPLTGECLPTTHKRCITGQACVAGECVGPCGIRECDDDGENCVWSNCGQCNDCVGHTCKPKKDPECPPCHVCGDGDVDCVYECDDNHECGLDEHGGYACVPKKCDRHWEKKCDKQCMNCANNQCYGTTCEDGLVCDDKGKGKCGPKPCDSGSLKRDCEKQCMQCEGDKCVGGCSDDKTCTYAKRHGYRCMPKCDSSTIHDCKMKCRRCDPLTGYCTGGCDNDEVCEKENPYDPYPKCMKKDVCDWDKVKECQGSCQKCKDGKCEGKCSDHVPHTACNTYGHGKFARSLCLSCNLPGRTCCDDDKCLGGLICDTYSHTCKIPPPGYVSTAPP